MLGGAKALYRGSDTHFDEEAAMRRGTLIHLLLEYLPDVPRPAWQEQAKQLLLTNDAFAVGPLADEIIQEGINVLTAPYLKFLFSDHAMAEVGITSPLSQLEGKQVLGTIDRLIDQGDHILAVDFKSNAIIPERPQDTPLGLLRQMGAYAAALEAVFPNNPIKTALLWTKTAELMELPHDMVMQALETAPLS
jgi:ATP-dependent helicase/nuclease subunit A